MPALQMLSQLAGLCCRHSSTEDDPPAALTAALVLLRCWVAGNAFAVYPASPVKSAAIVTMVVDQLTAYGLFVHPLCIMWEKLWRIHEKPNYLRLPARLPIGGRSCHR